MGEALPRPGPFGGEAKANDRGGTQREPHADKLKATVR
jgi:hypothetical protein